MANCPTSVALVEGSKISLVQSWFGEYDCDAKALMASPFPQPAKSEPRSIADLYQQVRARTLEIVAPLEIEDYVIQTAEFMSPPRWHIGHTSWFFETVLQKFQPAYKVYSDEFLFYFNS